MRVIIKRCCQKSTCSCKILRSKLIQSYNCYKQQPRGMIMGIRISDMIPDDDKMMMNINVWTGKKMKPPLQRRIFLCQLHNSLWWIPNSVSKVLTRSWKRPCSDNSNNTQQPICEYQVGFHLLWIRINQD